MKTKEQLMLRCSCLLVRVIRCGVSAKVLLKATLIGGSRLGCITYCWLTLLEFMVQFMWIVVLSCSARMAFLTVSNAADIRMLTNSPCAKSEKPSLFGSPCTPRPTSIFLHQHVHKGKRSKNLLVGTKTTPPKLTKEANF